MFPESDNDDSLRSRVAVFKEVLYGDPWKGRGALITSNFHNISISFRLVLECQTRY